MSDLQNLLNKKITRTGNPINDNINIGYLKSQQNQNQIQDLSKLFL
jgi:hypothetical protein